MSPLAEKQKQIVRYKYPLCEVRPVGLYTFQLFDGDKAISHMAKNADAVWDSAAYIVEVNR